MTNIALGSIHTYAALRAPSCRSDSCYSCDSVNGPLKPRPPLSPVSTASRAACQKNWTLLNTRHVRRVVCRQSGQFYAF